MSRPHSLRLVAALCFALISLSALADCEVSISYHTHDGFGINRQDFDESVTLAEGETRAFGIDNMNTLIALPTNSAVVSATLQPGSTTLNAGQRLPAFGNFLIPTRLVSLACASALTSPAQSSGGAASLLYGSATAMASAMYVAGQGAAQIAGAVKAAFGTTGKDMVALLLSLGFHPNQVLDVVRGVYGKTASKVAEWMVDAGLPDDLIGASLEQVAAYSKLRVARLLNEWMRTPPQIIDYLAKRGLSLQGAAEVLYKMRYRAGDVAEALKARFGASWQQVVTALVSARFRLGDVLAVAERWLVQSIGRGSRASRSQRFEQQAAFFRQLAGSAQRDIEDVERFLAKVRQRAGLTVQRSGDRLKPTR